MKAWVLYLWELCDLFGVLEREKTRGFARLVIWILCMEDALDERSGGGQLTLEAITLGDMC